MSDDRSDAKGLAAAYALGALEGDELSRFEARLAADRELADEVASYREVVAAIALGITPVEPRPSVRDEVLRRARETPKPAVEAAVPPSPRSPYAALPWEPGGVPGLQLHWIRRVSGAGESIVLMRGEPGTRYPDHSHTGEEHGFVLQGTFSDALGEYRAGDYVHYPAGSVHNDIRVTGAEVCIFLVVTGPVVPTEPAFQSS
ncbi:MAG: cupin domain-containing protein [Longimicrobiales bacterium]